MKVLKNLAVALLAFILFLSLTLFGFVFMVKTTVLNPSFVTAEIDKLDIPAVAKEMVQSQPPQPGQIDVNKMISDALPKIQPQIKAQADATVTSVYDYLLGNKPEPQLKATLRQTFLSTGFVTSVVNNVDVAPFLAPVVVDKVTQAFPIQVPNLDKYVLDALTAVEPSLKQQMVAASGPVFDYLLGTSNTLNTPFSLVDAKVSLKGILRQAFVDSPPTEPFGGISLSSIPPALRGAAFDQFYPTIEASIPTTFIIDQTMISAQTRADFQRGISDTEDSLRNVRTSVTYVQQAYLLLILIMALMLLGIILILRDVREVSRRLGVPLLTTGVIDFATAWVVNYLVTAGKIPMPQFTGALETWALQFVNDLLRPLQTFGIVVLIVGAVLTAVSFLYKRKTA